MKLDCILTAVNENPLYIEFIPIFVKTWNKLYPDIDVKIIHLNLLGGFVKFNIGTQTNSECIEYFAWVEDAIVYIAIQ